MPGCGLSTGNFFPVGAGFPGSRIIRKRLACQQDNAP
jgi:hypothetical protein